MSMLVSGGENSHIAEPVAETPPATREPGTCWVEIADRQSLSQHEAAWEQLGRHALEPNPFLEPFLVMPALKAYGADKDLSFAFIYRANAGKAAPTLCGFMPLERLRRFKGLPVSCLRLWEHDQCFVGTPLLHKEHARQTLQAFLDWLANDARSCPLFAFPMLPAEGPISQLLVDEIRKRALLTFQEDLFTRALLRRGQSAEAYLQEAISSNRRRDYKRKEKRLSELGKLQYRVLTEAADLPTWVEAFLRIEAAGWKGKEGTALACTAANKLFFEETCAAAFARGQMHMFGLFLDGTPIAIRCNFISGAGSFFFKPAYDEAHAKNSPGVLVELQNIQHMHDQPQLQWMDSCTSPDNTLLNDLWLDRRTIQTLVLATGRGMGRFAVSMLPMLRWLNRKPRKSTV